MWCLHVLIVEYFKYSLYSLNHYIWISYFLFCNMIFSHACMLFISFPCTNDSQAILNKSCWAFCPHWLLCVRLHLFLLSSLRTRGTLLTLPTARAFPTGTVCISWWWPCLRWGMGTLRVSPPLAGAFRFSFCLWDWWVLYDSVYSLIKSSNMFVQNIEN